MDDVGLEGVEKPGDGPELRNREPDRWVGWKRGRRNAQLTGRERGRVTGVARGHDDDLMAELAEDMDDPRDHCRDAVDLRRVSV
jgi:hypothetical protein